MASGAASTGSTKVDAVVQTIKAEEPKKLTGLALYSRFALAGAACCSITHGGLTPVDVYVSAASVSVSLPIAICAPFAAAAASGYAIPALNWPEAAVPPCRNSRPQWQRAST